MSKIWYDKSIEGYEERNKILIGIAALMFETNKVKFHELLNSLELPDNIGEDIGRIVRDMNYDDELNIRYYNWEEEQDRLNRSIIEDNRKANEKKTADQLAEEICKMTGEDVETFKADVRKKILEEAKTNATNKIREELRKEIETSAIEKGAEQNQKEMILNMKETGLSLEMISEISKLSIEEVEKILNN